MASKLKHVRLREKRNQPPKGEPWIWVTRELLESDAWRTAPLRTRLFIERLMLEDMAHAGTENGQLICTWDDCEVWGIARACIKATQADAINRGLVYRSKQGTASKGPGRRPHRFGLGWRAAHDGSAAPNLWKRWSAPYPQQDIKSSSDGCTKLNGGNPPTPSRRAPNKVQTGVLDKVQTGELYKLPPGWTIKKGRIITDDGITVPVVDDPMVGSDKEREALRRYQRYIEENEQLAMEKRNGC
jgi:hypothetical protein